MNVTKPVATTAKTETIKRHRKTITLICDEQGFWGWTVGKYTKFPCFFYRDTAIISAVRFIEG